MIQRVRPLHGCLFLLVAASGLQCSSVAGQRSEPEEGFVGRARIALTVAPPDARCMNLTVTGTRTVSSSFDLTPGQGAILDIDGLPLGMDTFSGLVFPVPCSSVTPTTTPSWKAVPTVVDVQAGVVNPVNLALQTNGQATVCLDFEGFDASPDGCVPREAGPRDASADAEQDAGFDAAACPTTFPAAATFQVMGASPFDLVLADFNGDGRRDIATPNNGSGNVSVLLANAMGSFNPPIGFAAGATPTGIVAPDLNLDGRPDIVVSNQSLNTLSVLFNSGTGTFGAPITTSTGTGPSGLATGDFNRDGRPDVAAAALNNGTLATHFGSPMGLLPGPAAMVGAGPRRVAVGDANNDMILDYFVANSMGAPVATFVPGTAGGFGAPVTIPTGTPSMDVAVGEFNGDGRLDLAVVNGQDVRIFLGTPAGAFVAGQILMAGASPASIATLDLTGDGRLDLAVGGGPAIAVLAGTGTGSFTNLASMPVQSRMLALGDLNGDGRPDIASVNPSVNVVTVSFAQRPAGCP